MQTVTIDSRFRGPGGMANGGYIAGIAASFVHAPTVQATLRLPTPLEVALPVRQAEGRAELLNAEGEVVVEARPATLDLPLPALPTREEAAEAVRRNAGRFTHSAGLCFCCGNVAPGGLRVAVGAVAGRPGLVAGLWQPGRDFAGADGLIDPVYLWTALDCPGAFGTHAEADGPVGMLLGRLTGQLTGRIAVDEPCLVLGWRIAIEGRKCTAGTAILGADGGVRGIAQALWFLRKRD